MKRAMYSGEGASSQVSLKLCASTRACGSEPTAGEEDGLYLSDEHSSVSGETGKGDKQMIVDVRDLPNGPLEPR